MRTHLLPNALPLPAPRNVRERVHAVVLNYHQSAAALRAYTELHSSRDIAMDVLLVDCASGDQERTVLRANVPDSRLLLLPDNRGYAGGMNAGAQFWLEQAPDVPVLLVTPDARIGGDVAKTLWQALASDDRAGVVGPVVIYSEQPRRIGAGVAVDNRGNVRGLLQIQRPSPYEVNSLDGCCLLLRPEALRATGGFDEAYFLYFEETDLCHRMRETGWRVCVVPSAFVHHPKAHNSAAPHVAYYMARNAYRFRTRHFRVTPLEVALGLARSNLWLTAVALGASLLPPKWPHAGAHWRNCWLAWRGAWTGTRDHLKGRYGPQCA